MELYPGIKVNRNNNMIENNRKQNYQNNEYNQNPIRSLRRGLPKNFFETVLDYEVRLKEKFDMEVFQKLIEFYSQAIEYYESINDPKYMVYRQSLSLLIEQPENKKYISGGDIRNKIKMENVNKI